MVFPVFLDEPGASPHIDERCAAYNYLCRRGARKFWRNGLERCDLEQVAAVGLVKAAQRYDATMQTPFEAYAWLMIVGELMHHVRDHERSVRIPRRLQSLERRFTRALERLSARLGREPLDSELADELGVLVPTVADVRRARATASPACIDDTQASDISNEDDLPLEERILVDEAFATLSLTERRVIAGIYLLGLTQRELARRLDLSAKRVSRLHAAALLRMQATLAS